jgi:hypothetical protein
MKKFFGVTIAVFLVGCNAYEFETPQPSINLDVLGPDSNYVPDDAANLDNTSDLGQADDQNQPEVCIPYCAGKECGPNGCGGTCGTCDDGNECTQDICENGKCLYKTLPEICGDGIDNDCDGQTDEGCKNCLVNLEGKYYTQDDVEGILTLYTCGEDIKVIYGSRGNPVREIWFTLPVDVGCFNISIDTDFDGIITFNAQSGEGWACNWWNDKGRIDGTFDLMSVTRCDGEVIKVQRVTVEAKNLAGGGNCIVVP